MADGIKPTYQEFHEGEEPSEIMGIKLPEGVAYMLMVVPTPDGINVMSAGNRYLLPEDLSLTYIAHFVLDMTDNGS